LFKLVIVDDEERIRTGLKKFMNWNSLGFDCVADFEDGAEAIEYLRNHEADVVLTDIRMAQVSGIEIARYVHEQKLRTKVVINSGYAQFEYAKRAIEYKVEHYLIKPTDIEETKKVFLLIRNTLHSERDSGVSDSGKQSGHMQEEDLHANIKRYGPIIVEWMKENKVAQVAERYDDFLNEIIRGKSKMLHLFAIDLFIEIETAFNAAGIDLYKLTGGQFDYRKLSSKRGPVDIRRIGNQLLMETVACLAGGASGSTSMILGKAQAYIEANYHRDISLEDVANAVFVTPSYFSRFYKQQTGETFIEYLTRLRLGKAVELLKQRKHKIYEISEIVGYKSSKYFNRQFKQALGCTPKEYARIVLKASDPTDE